MWRKASIGPAVLGPVVLGPAVALILLLPGCADFGDFVGDTLTYDTNPNLPAGNSENMRRVMGSETPVGVLQTEPGNVWPTGVESAPTLQELEQETNGAVPPAAPPPDMSRYMPGAPGAGAGKGGTKGKTATPGSGSGTGATGTPSNGTSGGTGNAAPAPGGGQPGEIVIPNGNGTSTIIKPDGTVVTVPTKK